MELIVGVVCGIIIGVVIGMFIYLRRIPIGNLRIDHSDLTSAPYLFLELNKDISHISNMKTITLHVRKEDFLSHK